MKACFLLAFAALASASFGAAIPKIRANSVSVSGSPDVTVTYELEGDAAIVTAEHGGAAMRNRAAELGIQVIDLRDLSAGRIGKCLHSLVSKPGNGLV